LNGGNKRCINATSVGGVKPTKVLIGAVSFCRNIYLYNIYSNLKIICNLDKDEEAIATKCNIYCIILHRLDKSFPFLSQRPPA
jgi:hypothetical protein